MQWKKFRVPWFRSKLVFRVELKKAGIDDLYPAFVFILSLLFAGSAVAAAIFSAAVARLCEFAVRANASLRHAAPEEAVAGAWHCGIRIRPDVLTFPMQGGAQSRLVGIESLWYVAHAAPPAGCAPAAARIARFTATRAR